MYQGIKRKTKAKRMHNKVTGKIQVLTTEEIEDNGYISSNYIFKTKEYKRDNTITWKDFEITNLIAAGINPKTLPTTILPANMEKLAEKASNAEIELDYAEMITELNKEQNGTTTEQTQQ